VAAQIVRKDVEPVGEAFDLAIPGQRVLVAMGMGPESGGQRGGRRLRRVLRTAYFDATATSVPEEGIMTTTSPTRAGFVVGLIAYASVAVFYSLFDFLASRGLLYTVNLLGRTVFRGLRDPGVIQYPVRLDLTAVFWYNVMHLVISLVIGLIVMRLVDHAERHPSRAALMLSIIVTGFVVTILAVGWLSTPIRPALPWWSIVVANTLAVLMAALYVLRQRPWLWGRLVPFASAHRG
jgi:hypothetical protein